MDEPSVLNDKPLKIKQITILPVRASVCLYRVGPKTS
jgi:hypothetical protein